MQGQKLASTAHCSYPHLHFNRLGETWVPIAYNEGTANKLKAQGVVMILKVVQHLHVTLAVTGGSDANNFIDLAGYLSGCPDQSP